MTELQAQLLELLKEFDQICRENEVEYYLVGGTLIGAMRHKGFVPWDDDVDVYMTRDNWEKFYTRTQGKLPEHIVVDTQYDEKGTGSVISRYIDTRVANIFRYNITSSEKVGLPIDVILIDPIPDNAEAKEEYIQALSANAELTILSSLYSLRHGADTQFTKHWRMSRLFGMKNTVDHIERKSFRHKLEDSELYVSRIPGAPNFYPKEVFGKPKYLPFEDALFPVPTRPDGYLCVAYDDEWMYIPSRGASKSTHVVVTTMTTPAKHIINEFKRHIDEKALMKTYVKRKRLQTPLTDPKLEVTLEENRFIAAKVQLAYSKKLAKIELPELLKSKNYDELEEVFADYIAAQRSAKFIGNASIIGWLNWYRRCHPAFIDIGDEAFYAVLVLLMHKQKLALIGKFLNARKTLDRSLSDNVREMDGLYGAIKAANSAYSNDEDEQCRAILTEWLPRHPENPFLWKLDLKERVRQGLSGRALIEAAQAGLELFPEDPELLYFQGREYLTLEDDEQVLTSEEQLMDDSEPILTDDEQLLEEPQQPMTNRDRALAIFDGLIKNTNHGLVLLQIRDHLEVLLESDPYDETLLDLWLNVRKAQGEEDVPTVTEWLAQNCPQPEGPAEAEAEETTVGEPEVLQIHDEAVTAEQTETVAENLADQMSADVLTAAVERSPETDTMPELEAPQDIDGERAAEHSESDDVSMPEGEAEEALYELTPEELAAIEAARKEEEAAERKARLTPIQLKRFRLMAELANICKENRIKYSLWGKTLLQAARKGRYVDIHGDLTVAMTPTECRKFIQAVEQLKRPNRYLDMMSVNPMFPRFCVRYCASDTLDFSLKTSACGERFGIYITIEILRYPSRDKRENKLNLMLEQGWESLLEMRPATNEVYWGRQILRAMSFVYGRKKVAQWLFNRLMDGPKKVKKGRYYIKPFWKEPIFYPDNLFRNTQGVVFEYKRFSAMKLYDQYLKIAYGAKWKTRKFPMTAAPGATRLVDTSIKSKEYLRYLNKQGIDRIDYWRKWYDIGKKWAPTTTLSKEIEHYWDIMCLCGERYRLWEKYMPMREYLIELFNKNKVKELMQELTDYYNTAKEFSKKKLGVCFDKRTFELLEYCLMAQGKVEQARQFRSLVPKQDWKPLKELPQPVDTPLPEEQAAHKEG